MSDVVVKFVAGQQSQPPCKVHCSAEHWTADTPRKIPGLTGLQIRTTCKVCGRFVGYKPASGS